MMQLPGGIVSFLFTDIEGSSARWEGAGAAMQTAVAQHDEALEAVIGDRNGVVIKKMGDGMMAVFASPDDAVAAAVAARDSLESIGWDPAVAPIQVRMGVHTGPCEPQDGDYLGPQVNRAARIEAAGHGGQILISGATRELLRALTDGVELEDLGLHHLRGLGRPERIFQVDRHGSPRRFPPLRTESPPSNLPSRTKAFVGRDEEIEQLTAALSDSRLVTVTGPGGAGKTTLAIEAARSQADAHPGGVWVFELASISDGSLIPAEMLGVMRRPVPADADPLDAVKAALESQQALLVFDNCEHLVAEVARIVSDLLHAAGAVTVLATSREALGIGGERAWAIPIMKLPSGSDREAVTGSDAGSLFVDGAKRADRAFELTEDDAPVVARICRRLDGLPLAIELAAARIRSMSPAEIDRRLTDRFDLLRSRNRDGLPHHQTLRETVAWSYDLLEPTHQEIYRKLSVFNGGFELDAAEAVMDDRADVADALDALAAQSMVVVERGDPTRFRMLETIREFGLECLRSAGEEHDARRAHLGWMADLVREGGRELEGRDQALWLRRFRREIDNIRAALGWAREHDPVTGATIMAALSRFFWLYGTEGDATTMRDSSSFLLEGHEWASSMLDAAGEDLPQKIRARLQMAIGGLLCIRSGRFAEALERLAEAAEIFSAENDTRGLAWVTFYQGTAGVGADHTRHETIDTFRRSVDLHTEAGDKFGILMGSLMLGFFEIGVDDDAARERLTWVHRATASSKIPALVAHGNDAAATLDACLGAVTDDSRRNAAEALLTFRSIDNYACVRHALHAASAVLTADGEIESAGRAYGVADSIQERLSIAPAPYETRDWMIAAIHDDAFESDVWKRARSEGATFEPDEGIDWVVGRLGYDPGELSPEP